jgi:N-acetyltransferase 10
VLETGRNDPSWLGAYAKDFHKRFLSLLSYQFRNFSAVQALAIDESANMGINLLHESEKTLPLDKAGLDELFTPFDLKRLDSYANNMLDYHVILDLMPSIAQLYFSGRIKGDNGVTMSGVQQALLCAIGLQRKYLDDVEKELNLPMSQLLAMFVKIIRKVSLHFRHLQEGAIAKELPKNETLRTNLPDDINGDGEIDGEAVRSEFKAELAQVSADFEEEENHRQKKALENGANLNLDKNWEEAEKAVREGKHDGIFSVKSSKLGDKHKRKAGAALAEVQREAENLQNRKSKKLKKHK